MIAVSFYLPPERVTLALLEGLWLELADEGMGDDMVPVGMTGHFGVLRLDADKGVKLLKMVERYNGILTDVMTDMGTYTQAFGKSVPLTFPKAKAFILMGGRMSGRMKVKGRTKG